MIPDLDKLPPLLNDSESPLKKLLRPFLGFLFTLGFLGGLVWLYTVGIKKSADAELNVAGGLQSIAAELWMRGTAKEIRTTDPDFLGPLRDEMEDLRGVLGINPEIMVIPAENLPGQPRASHEVLFMKNTKSCFTLRVWVDEFEGKVDIVSFWTNPELKESFRKSALGDRP